MALKLGPALQLGESHVFNHHSPPKQQSPPTPQQMQPEVQETPLATATNNGFTASTSDNPPSYDDVIKSSHNPSVETYSSTQNRGLIRPLSLAPDPVPKRGELEPL